MYRICINAFFCLMLTASLQPLAAQSVRPRADAGRPEAGKKMDRPAQVIIDSLNRLINRMLTREEGASLALREVNLVTPASLVSVPGRNNSVRVLISGAPGSSGVPQQATLTFDAAADRAAFTAHVRENSPTLQTSWLTGNRLVLRFSEPPSTTPPAASPAHRESAVAERDNSSGNAGLLLMITAALCAVAGLAAYLRSRLLLAKVRATTHGTAPWSVLKEQAAPGASALKSPDAPGHASAAFMPAAAQATEADAKGPAVLRPATHRHFFAEIMTTAGPRKQYVTEPGADRELGEDVCGFVADDRELLVYLLDGTSDQHALRDAASGEEYFSSRLLAQSLANQFRLAFGSNRAGPSEAVVAKAMEKVQQDWLLRLDRLPDAEKERLRSSIAGHNYPECSTTLLIAQLSLDGNATIYRSGDSKMFLFSNVGDSKIRFEPTTLMRRNDLSNDRLFFRLLLTPQGQFTLSYNKPLFEIVKKENLSTAVVFSDGIGSLTERSLQHYALDPEQVRRDIMYQSQGTADDKAICFITIRER